MASANWLRPPRSILTLYLVAAVATLVGLGWLAFRQVNLDELAEQQRHQQRLDAAGDRVSARLQQLLAGLERALAGHASEIPDGAVLVRVENESVRVERGAVPFLPVGPESENPSSAELDEAAALEFGMRNLGAAAIAYRRAVNSPSPVVRANALLALARVLRQAGDKPGALATYALLEEFDAVVIDGRPSALIASMGRCRVLEESGQRDELTREATRLRAELARGRWAIAGPVWHAAFEASASWVGDAQRREPEDAPSFALAEALGAAWSEWKSGRPREPLLVRVGNATALVVSDQTSGRALAIGAPWLDKQWRQIAADSDVTAALLDDDRRVVLGTPGKDAVSVASEQSGLPWTIVVSDSDPNRVRIESAGRRRIFMIGLGLVGLLIVGSGYLAFRGIRRELATTQMHADFVSAVSHEFRTPLTSIRQLSHLLESGRVTSEERRGQYYSTLTRESERLHRLVERLLKFGRAESDRLNFELVDARVLAEAVVGEFRDAIAARTVTTTLCPSPCPVRVDRDLLSLALWNLLDNAVKYSPADTEVRLSVASAAGEVRIAVRDLGVGIPAEDQRRIFHKFVRGSSSDTATTPGSGIGLALVDRVVRAHQGAIEVESTPGCGSLFTLVLPLHSGGSV